MSEHAEVNKPLELHVMRRNFSERSNLGSEYSREQAEHSREDAERGRAEAEQQRNAGELGRGVAETARRASEDARYAAEEARVARDETRRLLEEAKTLFAKIEQKRALSAKALERAIEATKARAQAHIDHNSALSEQHVLEAVWNALLDDQPG
jgi:membrane protein involved in colicin uptake